MLHDPLIGMVQRGIQTYLMWDAQAQMAMDRARMEGKDPERAYRRAMAFNVGKFVGLAFLSRHLFSSAALGVPGAFLLHQAVSGGIGRMMANWRMATSQYRSSVIPFMHSFEHTERSFQAMQQGIQAIHGFRSLIGAEAAVMAARYAR